MAATIYIGRDEKTDRLIAAGSKGVFFRGDVVPTSISRCKPTEDSAHCKVEIDENYRIKLINIKDQNCTFVNNNRINKAYVCLDARVFLGWDHVEIPFEEIMRKAGVKETVVIDHLYDVWCQYERKIEAIQLNQAKEQSKARLQSLFSMGAILLGFLPFKEFGVPDNFALTLRILIYVSAFGLATYLYFRSRNPKNTFIMQKKELEQMMRARYVCPKCGHFLGLVPYMNLVQQAACRYPKCRVRFVEFEDHYDMEYNPAANPQYAY